MRLTQHQLDACEKILRVCEEGASVALLGGASVALLGGAAGTGKTTCIRHIVDTLHTMGHDDVYVVTPTNKAAKVLRSKGLLQARTYHSLLFTTVDVSRDEGDFGGKKKITFVPNDQVLEALGAGKVREARYVIIDEASMICRAHLKDMRRMCKHLLLVGDPHQLPPIEDDAGRQAPAPASLGVFREDKLTAELLEIHRQAEGSSILELADALRKKQPVDLSAFAVRQHTRFRDAVKRDVQVLCYLNETRKFANAKYRERQGRRSKFPEPGDRMVFNDHFPARREWMAGETATVVEFTPPTLSTETAAAITVRDEDGAVHQLHMNLVHFWWDQAIEARPSELVPRSLRGGAAALATANLGFAYAITAHKAQGSEYEHVLVVDERTKIRGATVALQEETRRRWLYTCITRAKSKLHIVPQLFIFSK